MKCKYCNAMNPDGMPVCLYCARPLVEIDQKEKKEEIQEEIKKDPIPTPPPKKMEIPVNTPAVNTPVVNETVQPEIHNETVEPVMERKEEILDVKVKTEPIKSKKELKQEEKAKKKAEKLQKRNKKKEISSDSLDGTIESENGYAVNNERYYDNVQPEEMADTSATPKVFAAKAFSLIGAIIAVALLLIYYFG